MDKVQAVRLGVPAHKGLSAAYANLGSLTAAPQHFSGIKIFSQKQNKSRNAIFPTADRHPELRSVGSRSEPRSALTPGQRLLWGWTLAGNLIID